MKLLYIFILALNSFFASASQDSSIIGVWSCEPYSIGNSEFGFNVEHQVNYQANGVSIDLHTWKFTGPHEFWFSVEYRGPWQIVDGKLIETLEVTEVTHVSDEDFLTKEGVIGALAEMPQPEKVIKSSILELTNSKLVTKDLAYGNIGTCLRGTRA